MTRRSTVDGVKPDPSWYQQREIGHGRPTKHNMGVDRLPAFGSSILCFGPTHWAVFFAIRLPIVMRLVHKAPFSRECARMTFEGTEWRDENDIKNGAIIT